MRATWLQVQYMLRKKENILLSGFLFVKWFSKAEKEEYNLLKVI